MNDKKKRINRAGRQIVRGLFHGRAIIHELDSNTSGLFKPDGTHLTLTGNASFFASTTIIKWSKTLLSKKLSVQRELVYDTIEE